MESQWWGSDTAPSWRRTFTSHTKSIQHKDVAEITQDDILGVLKPIWMTKPIMAQKVRQRLETVLDAAQVRKLRSGDNPARWKGNLVFLLSTPIALARGHYKSMPHEDLAAFMVGLSQRPAISCRALEWTILSAARSGTTLQATWDEIDMDAKVWEIPAEKMKMSQPLRVPMSTQMIDLLEGLDRSSPLLFPNHKGVKLSRTALGKVLALGGHPYTPHGFRSTFRDWAGDETDFPRELAEVALAHQIGNTTERAYRRKDALEKRRALMQAWGDYCFPDGR